MGFSLGEGHGGDMAPLDHLSTRRVRDVDMGFRGHGGLRDMGGGTWDMEFRVWGHGDMEFTDMAVPIQMWRHGDMKFIGEMGACLT